MTNIELPGRLTPGEATAWILTRDKAFTLHRRYGSSVHVEGWFNAWKKAGNSFPFKSADKAARELLECVNSWAIEARGTHFRRKSPDGQFEQWGEPDGVISSTYLVWDAEDDFSLTSEDKCSQFRDVSIDTAGLLREFPSNANDVQAAAVSSKRHRTAFRRKDILDALAAKYPGGAPAGVSPTEARDVAAKWLKAQGRADTVSLDTARRALELYRSQSQRI